MNEQLYRKCKYEAILRKPKSPKADTCSIETLHRLAEPLTDPQTQIEDSLALYKHDLDTKYLTRSIALLIRLYKSQNRTAKALFFDVLEHLEDGKMSS